MDAPIQLPESPGTTKCSLTRDPEIEEIVSSLRALLGGDEREQRETFSFLKQALDKDRPSSRKLFPQHDRIA